MFFYSFGVKYLLVRVLGVAFNCTLEKIAPADPVAAATATAAGPAQCCGGGCGRVVAAHATTPKQSLKIQRWPYSWNPHFSDNFSFIRPFSPAVSSFVRFSDAVPPFWCFLHGC